MLLYILILLLPIITVVKGFNFKEETHFSDILSLTAFLMICTNINKFTPSLSIVIFEILGLFIYAIGLLFHTLKSKEGSQ